jgi:hypothetical protein
METWCPSSRYESRLFPAIFPFGKNFPVWKKSTTAVFKALKEHQKVEQSMKIKKLNRA